MGFYSDYVFPAFFDFVLKHQGFDPRRAAVLKQVSGRVLEIGIGTGLNLDYYPSSIREIWAIDPNPGMKRELEAKLRGHRLNVHFALSSAEQLPFKNGSFDTVLSTLTACTIPDLQKAFSEIRRVLAPGGKFIFLEHGLSHDRPVARMQRLLNPVQHVIGCGCSLTVNMEEELKKSDLHISSMKNYYVPGGPKILGHVYEGIATV